MSPYSLVVCRHQGGDQRAEDFDLIAVFWFYFLSSPWLWQLPLQPQGSWVVLLCHCRAQHPEQHSALGTLNHRLLFLFLPPLWLPKARHSVLAQCTWSCCLAGSEEPWSFLRFLWMVCCNIILYILFGNSWFSIRLLCFGAFHCLAVQGLFSGLVFFFFHSDSEKCFKNKNQWKLM